MFSLWVLQASGRWADPREIAEVIWFLSGSGASFITGADALADAGLGCQVKWSGPSTARRVHQDQERENFQSTAVTQRKRAHGEVKDKFKRRHI